MVEKSDWLSENEGEEEEVPQVEAASTEGNSSSVDSRLENDDASMATERSTDADNVENNEGNPESESEKSNEDPDTTFNAGDHIYSWCSLWGISKAYTHHGIVIDRDASAGTVTILDFSCLVDNENDNEDVSSGNGSNCSSSCSIPNSSTTSKSSTVSSIVSDGDNNNSILRSYTIGETQAESVWNKVIYGASFAEAVLTRRAGTVSMGTSDPIDKVLARAEFLMRNKTHLLSNYDALQSNCEHVAVWCKTGHFCSLQLLSGMGHSLALSAVPTVAASTATTTVPAAGLWGWFGYTTTVSLATVMPWLIPVTILGPAVAAGKSIFDTTRWRQTTESLNATFDGWKQTTDSMDRKSLEEDQPPLIHL
jgi:hypothetical protein